MFSHPTLWLYGNHGPFYGLHHSRANIAVFQAAGGKGSFFDLEVPGGNGHRVMFHRPSGPATPIAISARSARRRKSSSTSWLARAYPN